MAEPDHRYVGQPQHDRGQHPAMPGDQFTIVGHQARHGPAELGHAGRDLGDLVRAVDLGIARIGAQPVDRPGFNLARRKDQVHRVAFMWDRADMPMRAGRCQRLDQDPRCGEMENAREGCPPRAILR